MGGILINTIESVRRETGLTKPQMVRLVGARPNRQHILLSATDERIDPAFMSRANHICEAYRSWKVALLTEIDALEKENITEIRMYDLCRLTGVRELTIAALRNRGTLQAVRRGYEYFYTLDAVRALVDYNSRAISKQKYRGPLANAFLRWYERHAARTYGPTRDLVAQPA